MRRLTYRAAATAFVFTGLWFVLGLMLLWSPIPGALGIEGPLFVAWLFLFLALLALSGGMLTLTAVNGLLRTGGPTIQAASPAPSQTATASGDPLPWTRSPLPRRAARSERTTTPVRAPRRPSATTRPATRRDG